MYMNDGSSFLDSIIKFLQAKSFIDDMKYRNEQRQVDRERYQREVDDYNRSKQMEDFKTALLAHQSGLLPVDSQQAAREQTAENALTSAFGAPTSESYKPLVGLPMGRGNEARTQMYRLPSYEQTMQRELSTYGAKKALDIQSNIFGKVQEEQALQPYKTTELTFPAMGDQPETKVKVPNANVATALKAIQDMRRGKIVMTGRARDNEGNETLTGYNVDTKEPITIPLGKIGQSAAPTIIQGQLDENTKGYKAVDRQGNTLFSGTAPNVRPARQRAGEKPPSDKELRTTIDSVQRLIDKARTTSGKAQQDDPAAWDAARDAAYHAGSLYPDYIEVGGTNPGEYPYIKLKSQPPKETAPAAPKTQTRTKKIISAADFDEVVKSRFNGNKMAAMAEAKRLGWTIQ